MKRRAVNFDRLARIYRGLEFVAFGRDLERARFEFLARVAAARSILILGEGDGRCLARLVAAAPRARIHCVDSSPAMLARAAARLDNPADRQRVTFECADVLKLDFPRAAFDAAITFFFLDCFAADVAAEVVRKIADALEAKCVIEFASDIRFKSGQ